MYGALWRLLPGRWPAKLALTAVWLAAVLAVLWFLVFPVAEERLPLNDVTVKTTGTATPGP